MTEQQALESTYWDKVNIFRRINFKDPDTGQTRQKEIQVTAEVPCALSRNQDTSNAQLSIKNGYGTTDSVYTLFCSPGTEIVEGDRLEVITKAGQRFSLRTGRPFAYPSHMEIPVKEEKRACGN